MFCALLINRRSVKCEMLALAIGYGDNQRSETIEKRRSELFCAEVQ